MEEIAQQFKEELQELLDRYKDKMSTPQIMRIAQPIFTKTIGFKDNPERFKSYTEINGLKVPAELVEEPDPEFRKMMQGEFRCIDELESSASHNTVTGIDLESSMMHLHAGE